LPRYLRWRSPEKLPASRAVISFSDKSRDSRKRGVWNSHFKYNKIIKILMNSMIAGRRISMNLGTNSESQGQASSTLFKHIQPYRWHAMQRRLPRRFSSSYSFYVAVFAKRKTCPSAKTFIHIFLQNFVLLEASTLPRLPHDWKLPSGILVS
jgi:hypothetical protein